MTASFDNVYNSKEIKARLTQAFDELVTILTQHAGPFATNAVIGSRWRQMNDIDEFTKDGIKILQHLIVSDDAVDRFAARMTRFVGMTVDKRCHDGTTTSMLLFSLLAKIAIEKMDTSLSDRCRYQWTHYLKMMFDTLQSHVDDLKITEDELLERALSFGIETTLPEIREAIAFHMAMISSKGDVDLSSKIGKLIRSTPKTIYGMYTDTPLAVETKENYVLKKQDYDISIGANAGNVDLYNHANDTQYLSENAVIFASGNELVTGQWEVGFLRAFISEKPNYRADLAEFGVDHGWKHYHEGKRNLVIMAPMISDSFLMEEIMIFNKKNPNCKIAYFLTHAPGLMKTNLNKTIHCISGTPYFKDVMHEDALRSLIGLNGPGIKVQLIGSTMTLTGLYERTDEVYHPFYSDPEKFPQYTKFREETEEMLDFAQKNITNSALDPKDVSFLTSLYRILTVQEIYDIEVGGSAHDQYANRTVYEDAVGAALAAINEGVVLSGYAHFTRILFHLGYTDTAATLAAPHEMLCIKMADALYYILTSSMRVQGEEDDAHLRNILIHQLKEKWDFVSADSQAYLYGDEDTPYMVSGTVDKETLEAFLRHDSKKPILIQAWSGYQEQFSRFKDILPRLANTTNLVDMRVKDGDNLR